jgi:hypothetical protein
VLLNSANSVSEMYNVPLKMTIRIVYGCGVWMIFLFDICKAWTQNTFHSTFSCGCDCDHECNTVANLYTSRNFIFKEVVIDRVSGLQFLLQEKVWGEELH